MLLKQMFLELQLQHLYIKQRILSTRYKNQIFIKREDLQPVFSFKCRGAYNKIRQLSNHERSAGIIAASAGNHAQGVAMSSADIKY